MRGTRTISVANSNVNYTLDAAGNLTSDGLRTFEYDEANRMSKAKVFKDGEEATVRYLHNALGQRVFQGEPQASQTLPNQQTVGQGFIDWLKSNFGWMFQQQATTSIGTAFVYADGFLPSWAILGDYDNGSASGNGKSEYIWLPTGDGAIPVGLFRNGRFFAIHTDHLGTPRLMANDVNKPVWQWPYSAFGATKPTGILKATVKPKNAMTSKPVMLKSTTPAQDLVLRYPGQMNDVETGTLQNNWRSYWAMHGRYTQFDPIGLAGGVNGFLYAYANPLSFTDPTGLQVPFPFGGGAAGGVGGAGGLGGFGGPIGGSGTRPVDPTDPNGPQYSPAPGMSVPNLLQDIVNRVCPPENECDKLNEDVKRAKDKVGRFQPAACSPGMSKGELAARASAWLELAVARAKRDQKCWAGGDAGHQQAQADAWSNLGRCQRLLR